MKKFFTETAAVLLAVLLALPLSAIEITANNAYTRTYQGEFTDVSESAWYYDSVVSAYSFGLINGKTSSTFAPDQTVTIAESVKLAALCCQILTSGSVNEAVFETTGQSHWYDGYLSYCIQNGIVTEEYENYNAAASRAQIAILFSRAIISSGVDIKDVNNAPFGSLPDVDNTAWYAGAVYRMVRWGILSGDANGNINPESSIKRSEISAILMRVIDENKRVLLGTSANESSDASTDNGEAKNPEEVPDKSDVSAASITLYEGSRDNKAFTGVTGFAGEFTVSDGISTTNAAYSLDLVNSLTLEKDNISFRLYTGAGFEALGIVRGWLNENARGKDGAAIHEKSDVYSTINELCYVWINGKRALISEMWYADHGDYTTYAFYFDKNIAPSSVSSVSLMVGRLDSDTLSGASMSDLASRIEQADKEGIISPEDDIPISDTYTAAIADAKESAAEIIFEYECQRCTILYGRGLYGRENGEYRLLFIFRDGTTQTVAAQKLDDIRMNSSGNVLYYTMTGPDGKTLQYGINFGE